MITLLRGLRRKPIAAPERTLGGVVVGKVCQTMTVTLTPPAGQCGDIFASVALASGAELSLHGVPRSTVTSASAPHRLENKQSPGRGGDRGLRYASQGTRDASVGYQPPIPWAILHCQHLALVTFLQPNQSRGVRGWRR